MKSTVIALGLFFFCFMTVEAQQNPLQQCRVARDTAQTRVTIVSNSRVLMEEDLASMSVTLRYERQRIRRMEEELTKLQNELRLLKKENEEKAAEAKTEDKTEEAEQKEEQPAEKETN